MSQNLETAKQFFDACETGQGWAGCQAYCHPDATFSAQADALAEVQSIEAYSEWMKGLLVPAPNASYEVKFMAEDEERQCVAGYAIFRATHTDPGGPVEPTGLSAEADYVYAMYFDGDRIKHMTKIWNDGFSLRQLGWA